jgi:hypothetical protein
MTKLCENLQPIYNLEIALEIALENKVIRIDEPAGTECPYAIVFSEPLHHAEIKKQLNLTGAAKYWESRDPHYEYENGYLCENTRHGISGPL